MFDDMILKIRRRETPFYARLYRLGKYGRHLEMVDIPFVYKFLYYERMVRLTIWRNCSRIFYNQPVFKARCERTGKDLRLTGSIPLIMGHLRLVLGSHVMLNGACTFTGSKLAEQPLLEIGDWSNIGYQVVITVGTRVTIGKHVKIGTRCFIAGSDNHPLDPLKRRSEPESADMLREVTIEDDVFIATGSTICKGVTIGTAAVVAAGSVVTENVPPYTLVGGNPAKVIRPIPRPDPGA